MPSNDPITLDTLKSLKRGDAIVITKRVQPGSAITIGQRWRVNGKVQTWKRDPSRVRVPLKFGLYAYDQVTEAEIDWLNQTGARIERRGY